MSQVVQQRPDELISILQPEFYGKANPLSCQVNGRLTLTSGVPFTFSDQTAAATVYYTPFDGDITWVRLSDGYWVARKFAELSVAVPATKYRFFDVFVYDNAGALALQTQNWNQTSFAITGATNLTPITITAAGHTFINGDVIAIEGVTGNLAANGVWNIYNVGVNVFDLYGSAGSGVYVNGGTAYKMNGLTRATAVSRVDGRYVQTADNTKLLLGTACTTDVSGRTESSQLKRLLYNLYNRQRIQGRYASSASHGYNSTTARYWNNSPAAKILIVHAFDSGLQDYLVGLGGGIAATTAGSASTLGAGNASASAMSVIQISSTVATAMRFGAVPRLADPNACFTFWCVIEVGHAGVPVFSSVELDVDIFS